MRQTRIIILIILMGCGGSLSEEQRKQLREAQEQQTIMKVSEADLLQAAFDKGRSIMPVLERQTQAPQIDSLSLVHQVTIRWLDPNMGNALDIENQLIEAYIAGAETGNTLNDNIQRLSADSLLYTKAIVKTLPDGRVEIIGTWNIRISTRQLVLSMK